MRNYYTLHQGIAAYLILQGHKITDATASQTKAGRPCVKFEFDVDPQSGRELADDFYNGNANGNLKAFFECLSEVRQTSYNTKNNQG
jgi:preprotein translocase subunit SecD